MLKEMDLVELLAQDQTPQKSRTQHAGDAPELTLRRIFAKGPAPQNRSRSAVWALDGSDGLRINVARVARPKPDQGWQVFSVYTTSDSELERERAKAWAERKDLYRIRARTLREICAIVRQIYAADPARLQRPKTAPRSSGHLRPS